jgi:hypothetical protein
MREFLWPRGRVYIANSPEEWPHNSTWFPRTGEQHTLLLPAEARAGVGAVALLRMIQHASGASYYARIGGQMTPGSEPTLNITIDRVDDHDMDYVLGHVIEGLTTMPSAHRPMGNLHIAWFVIHPVDSKPHAWRNTAAAMCRLLCADVSALDDEAVLEIARNYTCSQ